MSSSVYSVCQSLTKRLRTGALGWGGVEWTDIASLAVQLGCVGHGSRRVFAGEGSCSL